MTGPLSVDPYAAALRVEIGGAVRGLRLGIGELRALQAEATAARRALDPGHPPIGPEWLAREILAGRALADDVAAVLRLAARGGGADAASGEAVGALVGAAPSRWKSLAVSLLQLALTGPEEDQLPPFGPAGPPGARPENPSPTARSDSPSSTATAR